MKKLTPLTPHEAKTLVPCGYDKLMQLVRTGQIPHYRIGRRVFFTEESLRAWIENMQMQSVQPGNKKNPPTIAK
jgi:excisionase family DNA binding protein